MTKKPPISIAEHKPRGPKLDFSLTPMRCLLLLIFLYTSSTKIEAEYNLPIPSDLNGKYFILERSGSKKMPILATKRVGKSGTYYSKLIFDCKAGTAKYLGDGETLSKMNVLKPNQFGPIVEGSIIYYKWCHACGELPMPFELCQPRYIAPPKSHKIGRTGR